MVIQLNGLILMSNTKLSVDHWFCHQSALFCDVIILFLWRGISGRFVCLNGGLMTDNKGLQAHQCQKTQEKVKPFFSRKKAERLVLCAVLKILIKFNII